MLDKPFPRRPDWAGMARFRAVLVVPTILVIGFLAGCLQGEGDAGPDVPPTSSTGTTTENGGLLVDVPLPGPATPAVASFAVYTLPAIFTGPIGLYEPTIDVADDGAIYVSAHSTDVGRNPAPVYYSLDDGKTWQSMALILTQQGQPSEQGSAPLLSDEVFVIASEGGMAWGMDCCTEAHNPLVGWCQNGAEACYYNQNARVSQADAVGLVTCQALPTTDRPWLAYNDGKLLLVNNPGGGPLQVGSMDVPPLLPIAYTGTAWQVEWNLCGSSGGFIPGIPDMRPDHFFAVPQWQDYGVGCGQESHYDVITGNANDMAALTQKTVFANSHVAPAEDDSTPSNIGLYGQVVFDSAGALYVGAMNNTAREDGSTCVTVAGVGAIHFALSTDDAASFKETTFRFDAPVSSFYMDGNRHGLGFLLNWGLIDGSNTDWYVGHVLPNPDGTLRLENVMLAVNDGPEASRHVQGAAMGPDGRAYLALSMNSQNPGGATSSPGDTPLRVAVQQSGPTMVVGPA